MLYKKSLLCLVFIILALFMVDCDDSLGEAKGTCNYLAKGLCFEYSKAVSNTPSNCSALMGGTWSDGYNCPRTGFIGKCHAEVTVNNNETIFDTYYYSSDWSSLYAEIDCMSVDGDWSDSY